MNSLRVSKNMNSDENSSQSGLVAYVDITNVKREQNEESSGESDTLPQGIYLSLEKLHGIVENNINENSISSVKRKNSEEYSLNMQEDDRMSDVTNNSHLIKRPRYVDSQSGDSFTNSNEIEDTNSLQLKEEIVRYTLCVTNSPGIWTSQEIIDFITRECGINITKINDSREGNSDSDFQIKLKFPNQAQSIRVFDKLKEMEAEGNLSVYREEDVEESNNDVESDVMDQTDERESNQATDEPLTEDFELASDENGFYVREEYLKSLGIKMPITNLVTVTNFRCDKSELKEVLELAGRVLVCSVVSISNKYANVMYSHPLEAVQAISMLNGQKLYGLSLKITMNNSRECKSLLPKGLAEVGPGLGKYGKALPDLVEQFKRFVKGQKSSIDAHLFQPELLKNIGIDLSRESSTSFVRSAPSTSSSHHNENISEHGSDVSPSGSMQRHNGNQLASIGSNISLITSSTPVNAQFQSNSILTPMNQPIIIRGTMQRPRYIAPGSNTIPLYADCPPIPGFDTSISAGGSFNISVISSSSRPVIPGPIITRDPMPGPMLSMRRQAPVTITHMSVANRFTSPIPRNVGPIVRPMGSAPIPGPIPSIPMSSPMRSTGPGGPLRPYRPQTAPGPMVQMFIGTDPVTVQMSNLPPSTTFLNLGQKLSEFGTVVYLEFTTPGCAVVRFANPSEAERCLQNYRHSSG